LTVLHEFGHLFVRRFGKKGTPEKCKVKFDDEKPEAGNYIINEIFGFALAENGYGCRSVVTEFNNSLWTLNSEKNFNDNV